MKTNKTILGVISIILFFITIYIIQPVVEKNIKLITLITMVLILIFYYLIVKPKKQKTKDIMVIVIVLGILIRAMYIVYTPVTERQHDVYTIEDDGHLGYIYTIYETGELPKTNSIQFYHPPLFHAIAAGWLKVNDIFNVDLNRAIEGIQIITAIFSSLILVVIYKVSENLKIREIYKLLIISVISFHPTFIILAGSINNDILMILLSFCIILYLIKWHKNADIKNTVVLAIITGLCVMTKISGAIMAVPIIITFIEKIIEIQKHNKKQLLNLFGKFVLFGIISLPLGLWHPIRNAILFKQPIGGVLIPGQSLYIGNYSIIQRVFGVSFEEFFKQLYCTIPGDYNIIAFIIKSSIFGEFSYSNIALLSIILKLTNTIIILISIIFTLILAVKNNKKNDNYFIIKILLITWLVNIISYYSFNLKYPYTCTMDFRYLVPTIFTGIVAICVGIENYIKNDVIRQIIEYIIVLFCVLSFIFAFAI